MMPGNAYTPIPADMNDIPGWYRRLVDEGYINSPDVAALHPTQLTHGYESLRLVKVVE
jgi:hypothetical protein